MTQDKGMPSHLAEQCQEHGSCSEAAKGNQECVGRCALSVDAGCICQGNWRLIVSETEHLIGKKFRSHDGNEFNFFGLVHAEDDYYYGLWSKEHGLRLLSCVGDIETYGYTLVDAAAGGTGDHDAN